jgi:hypothetical protein
MTTTAIFCFVVIVLAASLRAFVPGRAGEKPRRRTRRLVADVVLGRPVQTLDLVGERRPGGALSPFRLSGDGSEGDGGRIGDRPTRRW